MIKCHYMINCPAILTNTQFIKTFGGPQILLKYAVDRSFY
jgi:hypothetical protein